MRTKNTAYFDILARDMAVTIGATVRRWWLEPKNAQCFHVEAVRSFVGAKPVVVHFTATLDMARPPQLRGQPQMQVVTETPRPAPAAASPDGVSPVRPRRPRLSRRTRAAQPRARGIRCAAEIPPRTAATQTRHKSRPQSRSRARR